MRIMYDKTVFYEGTVSNVNGVREFQSMRYGLKAAHTLLNVLAMHCCKDTVSEVLDTYQQKYMGIFDSCVFEQILARTAVIYGLFHQVPEVRMVDIKYKFFYSCSIPLTLALCEFISQVRFSEDELYQFRSYLR